jgi:hypothetical protein
MYNSRRVRLGSAEYCMSNVQYVAKTTHNSRIISLEPTTAYFPSICRSLMNDKGEMPTLNAARFLLCALVVTASSRCIFQHVFCCTFSKIHAVKIKLYSKTVSMKILLRHSIFKDSFHYEHYTAWPISKDHDLPQFHDFPGPETETFTNLHEPCYTAQNSSSASDHRGII